MLMMMMFSVVGAEEDSRKVFCLTESFRCRHRPCRGFGVVGSRSTRI